MSPAPLTAQGPPLGDGRWNAELLRLATTLSDLAGQDAITAAVARWAREVSGAVETGVFLLQDDGSLVRSAIDGVLNPEALDHFVLVPPGAPMPVRTAIEKDLVLWFETEQDWSDYPDIEPWLRSAGYPTTAVVPLTVGDVTVGALYADFEPGRVLSADVRGALEIVGELAAQNIRRAALFEETLRATAVLDAMAKAMPIGMAIIDRELRFVQLNEEMARINGKPLVDHLGRTLDEVMPTLTDEVRGNFAHVLGGGDAIVGRDLIDPNAPNGPATRGTAAVRASWFPIRDRGGEVMAAGVLVEDVSTRVVDEQRLALLAELSNLLADTLSRDAVTSKLADVLVPRLGHLAAVLVVEGRTLRTGSIRSADGELRQLVSDAIDEMPEMLEVTGLLGRVLLDAEPLLLTDYEPGEASEGRFAQVHSLTRLHMGSLMVLPMRTGDLTHGVIILGRTEGSLPYDEQDLAFARIVARRGGMALDNARLYARLDEMAFAERERADRFAALEAAHREIARALQVTLIPANLPEPPGTDTATRYLPIGVGVDAGGDTYDLFQIEDGWLAVMADVCGKGPDAAAITSLLRHAIRSRSLHDSDPAQLLAHVNHVLRRHDSSEDARFVTAQIARLRPTAEGIDIALASAGHPPPVLVRRTATTFVETPGRLLGLFDDIDATTEHFTLASGDSLLFYTDGVTEARDPDGTMFGEPRLLGSVELAARRGMGADSMLGHLERAVRGHVGDANLSDDVALLAVRAV